MSNPKPAAVPPGPAGTRIETLTGRGRSLVASREYVPGEVIATFQQPLLILPDGGGMRVACNWCMQLGDEARSLRACTACKAAVYCGRSCQRNHWDQVHKAECKAFKRVRASSGRDWLPTPVRAAIQLLLRIKAGDSSVTSALGPNGFLQGNVPDFMARATLWNDFSLQAKAAVVYGALEEAYKADESINRARDIICKIQTNAFHMLDPDCGLAGIFLDSILAMVNHSCEPNAFVTFDKRTATLRALASIEDGDEIEISYIDHTLPRCARKEALDLYHFQCQCSRCAGNKDVYQYFADSTANPLNSFSLLPDTHQLQKPPIDTTLYRQLSAAQVERIYNGWLTMDNLSSKWRACAALVDAKMFAVEPVCTTLRQAMDLIAERGRLAHVLSIACLISTHVDPYKYPAPFEPFRIKGLLMIAKLLSQLAPVVSAGLSVVCQHEGLSRVLAKADLVSICESILRMAMYWGAMGTPGYILRDARDMLRDIERLEGRKTESDLIQAWAANPSHPEGALFLRATVFEPIQRLGAFAVDVLCTEVSILEYNLWLKE